MAYQRIGSYDIWTKKEKDTLIIRFEWLSVGIRYLEVKVDLNTIQYSDNGAFRKLTMDCNKGKFEIIRTPIGITKLKLLKWNTPIFWGKGKESKSSSIIDEIVELAALSRNTQELN